MRGFRMLLAGILILAALLRIRPVLTESVWEDEMFTRKVMLLPPAEALQAIRFDFVHPPTFYLVERAAVTFLGDGHLGLRLVSLLSSLGLVLAGGLFAGAITGGNPWASLSTALLLAVSDMQISQAYNGRSYALYALEILLASWAFYRVVLQPDRRGPKVAFAMLAVASVTTHYLAVLYLLALGLVCLTPQPPWPALRRWVGLMMPAAAAAAAWLLYLKLGESPTLGLRGLGWIVAPTWEGVRDAAARILGLPGSRKGFAFAAGFLCLVTWIGLRHRTCRVPVSSTGMTLVGSLMVVPALLMLVISLFGPQSIWVERQLLPTQAFVAIGMGIAVAVIARRNQAMALAALAGLVLLNNPGPVLGPSLPQRAPYNRVAADFRSLRSQREPILSGDAVALVSLNYYLAGPDTGRRIPPQTVVQEGWQWAYPALPDSSLTDHRAIWVVSRRNRQAEVDSLVRGGWRIDRTDRYLAARRWQAPVSELRLDRLLRP